MKKAVLAATAAALIAGASVSFAAPGPGGPGGPGRHGGMRLSVEDQTMLTDARFAALQTALKLNADQQKLLTTLHKTVDDVTQERAKRGQAAAEARREARKADERPAFDPVARMRASAERMDSRAAELRKIADAADPFFKSLDADQKQKLDVLARGGFATFLGGFRHPVMGAQGWGPQGPGKAAPAEVAPGDADADADDAADAAAE